MSNPGLSYAVVTPARDEEDNLLRLAVSLASQTVPPEIWVVVDDASTDATADVVQDFAANHPWTRLVNMPPTFATLRGGKVVRAFSAGLAALPSAPDVVVKVDADVSFPADYFARLLTAFADNPHLGMASGGALERKGGVWKARHMTAGSLWGAARAYRWSCLHEVLPLDERMGWDGIDALKANVRGWETEVISDLWFRHHRLEGERDGARTRAWSAQGRASHYMGYRPLYLLLRAIKHARREPAAMWMILGYVHAAVSREDRCDDEAIRATLRRRQRLREAPSRALESLGRRTG